MHEVRAAGAVGELATGWVYLGRTEGARIDARLVKFDAFGGLLY